MARFEIAPDEFTAAWDKFMSEWFPESGYQPDDRPCFELYLNDPREHPEGHFIIDICEPVKPL
jgi:AraC family transcriptional regulator